MISVQALRCCAILAILSCFFTLSVALYMLGSSAFPIFAEVKQRCQTAEEHGVSYCFVKRVKAGRVATSVIPMRKVLPF